MSATDSEFNDRSSYSMNVFVSHPPCRQSNTQTAVKGAEEVGGLVYIWNNAKCSCPSAEENRVIIPPEATRAMQIRHVAVLA